MISTENLIDVKDRVVIVTGGGRGIVTGMQGDRPSVVFAAPAEISSFIKQTCQ